jgi:hypothetical protein
LGFSPVRVIPKDARFLVAATGDLGGHGVKTGHNERTCQIVVAISGEEFSK